ncbi:unnamed protein product, partial [Scytosiphon promiscuus]
GDLAPLRELVKQWPGRKEEIHELAGLIGESTDGVPVPPLLVTGPPCSGKTSVVRAVLEHRGCSYTYVNCVEVVRRRDLLEAVVEQVAGGSREDILTANRVDRSFGSAAARDGGSSAQPGTGEGSLDDSNARSFTVFAQSSSGGRRERVTVLRNEAFLHVQSRAGCREGGAFVSRRTHQRKRGEGRSAPQRPKCSSWNVFFRQLAALLARRSSALAFAPKLFVVLDNAEALLSESVAGIGVGAGGSGAAGNHWRDQDVLTKLAGLQGMVDSLTGFAGDGGTIGTYSSAEISNPFELFFSFARRSAASSDNDRSLSGNVRQRPVRKGKPTPNPEPKPGSVTANGFFASEVMGGRGGGLTEYRSAGGRNRSLVACVSPVQLRFPPYTKEQLPDVIAATAHMFGLDLNVRFFFSIGGALGTTTPTDRRTKIELKKKPQEGRGLFRKMVVALVADVKSGTSDAWELGAEAARIWPAYRRFAEDGCLDAELSAALKPLLKDTTNRLHGKRFAPLMITPPLRRNKGSRWSTSQGQPEVLLGDTRTAKHLLVSAYLASHNSRDTDRDVFTSKSTRRSKRLRTSRSTNAGAKGNAESLVEAGVQDLPEAREFQLERLLSIMSSIVAVTEAATKAANSLGSTELFVQIKSLTKLNLVRSCGHRKNFDLDCPSYRYIRVLTLAEAVAKEIGLDLSQYLVTA